MKPRELKEVCEMNPALPVSSDLPGEKLKHREALECLHHITSLHLGPFGTQRGPVFEIKIKTC